MGERHAEESRLSLRRVNRAMDIYFCDICNESVPQTDLALGMAFRRGERVVCTSCDQAMSNEPDENWAEEDPSASPDAAESNEDVQAAAPPVVSPVPGMDAKPERVRGKPVGLGFMVGFLFFLLLLSLGFSAYLWFEGDKAKSEFQASLAALEKEDETSTSRFKDLQANLDRQVREKDEHVRGTLESMRGDTDEKFAVLGNRLGRNENSLEGLRQSTAEDRRALEGGAKDALEVAGVASKATEAMEEDLGYLVDRVTALEEVLEGGMVSAGGGDSGKQPNWYSHLPELKDASAGNRWNAVTVLGDTGDPRVVPHLLPMLGDDDVFVRMATARVLGDLGIPSAIPGLIDALSDRQAAVREAAVVALRVLSGKDFRFDPLGKEGDRAKAQGTWRKWWADNSEDLLGG